jgi:hypothetical protein
MVSHLGGCTLTESPHHLALKSSPDRILVSVMAPTSACAGAGAGADGAPRLKELADAFDGNAVFVSLCDDPAQLVTHLTGRYVEVGTDCVYDLEDTSLRTAWSTARLRGFGSNLQPRYGNHHGGTDAAVRWFAPTLLAPRIGSALLVPTRTPSTWFSRGAWSFVRCQLRPRRTSPAPQVTRPPSPPAGSGGRTAKIATAENLLPLPLQFLAAWIGIDRDVGGRPPGAGDRVPAC